MRSAGGGYEKKSFALPTQVQRGQQIVVLVVAVVGCGWAGRIGNLPWVVSTRSLGLKRLSTLGPCLVTGPLSTTASSSERNDDGSGSGGTSRHGPTRVEPRHPCPRPTPRGAHRRGQPRRSRRSKTAMKLQTPSGAPWRRGAARRETRAESVAKASLDQVCRESHPTA